jgi:hypothetical protein
LLVEEDFNTIDITVKAKKVLKLVAGKVLKKAK